MPLDSSHYQEPKRKPQPELPTLQKPQPNPTAQTREALAHSSQALGEQVQGLVQRMDASDRQLARQLAGYVANRPNRFKQLLASELDALMNPAPEFVDVAVFEPASVEFGQFAIAPSTVAGALPM